MEKLNVWTDKYVHEMEANRLHNGGVCTMGTKPRLILTANKTHFTNLFI